MKKTFCDACEKELLLTLDAINVTVAKSSHVLQNKEFCSWRCVQVWAVQSANVQADVSHG